MRADPHSKYLMKKCACTGSFIVLLFLLSWWYGPSKFEKRFDPVGAAHEERDAAIKERNDAQRAWGEMGAKYERAIQTTVEVQDEFRKAYKDLPWLNQKNLELAEENTVQYNEIERLRCTERKYSELLDQVSEYRMAAKPPEYYQKRFESVQRQFEVTNKCLQNSERRVKALGEQLVAQKKKTDDEEKNWLRAQLKKNSRSAAYWAKCRTNARGKPAWGIRYACTQPEIAYGLKDQAPRIVELEATVAARDLTVTRLRASRGSISVDDRASASKSTQTSLPSREDSISDPFTGSQPIGADLEHTCKYEQQCKSLSQQVADDTDTIRQLREECQDLRHGASEHATAAIAEANAKAKLETDLLTERAVIESLQKEQVEVAEELAGKNKEIDDLREESRSADKIAKSKILDLDRELSKSRQTLVDAHNTTTERERELEQSKNRISELEAAQRGLEDDIRQKDLEIDELEKANQELAELPGAESQENLQRLQIVNTNLDDLRRQLAECREQSETQKGKISDLEATRHELEVTIKLRDDRIVGIEKQISEAPKPGFVESQNQLHHEAIKQKDRDYRALYDEYQKILGRHQLEHNESVQAFNTLQQSHAAKHRDLQHLFTECQNVRSVCATLEGRIADLANQLRQGANTYTDLQIKYNTQAAELDTANQDLSELRSEVVSLRLANANLGSVKPRSEDDVEKYRLEGEDRARPIWQANFDREVSARALELEEKERSVFKLENQLQQAKNQASPLRELQLKSREYAVKLREDVLNRDTEAMDHDQHASNQVEIKALESKVAIANKEAGDAKLRNRGIQNQLNKERKERKDEKERFEKEFKKEQEDAKNRSDILKLRLEKENPLRGTVSQLQNEVARLKKELGEQRAT